MEIDYNRLALGTALTASGTASFYSGLKTFVGADVPRPADALHPPPQLGLPDSLGAAAITMTLGGVAAAYGLREMWHAVRPESPSVATTSGTAFRY